jgi:hypothetical protein
LETPRRPDLLIPRPPPEPPLEAPAHQRARIGFWEKRSSGPTSREPPPTASVAPLWRAMSNAGIGLRIIQEISGHSNLEQLQRYARGEAGSSQRSVSLSFHAFLHGES